MEFLTSADSRHLCGRTEKTTELLTRIDANQITLLLGNSDSGKTSLIHAGLFPEAIRGAWFLSTRARRDFLAAISCRGCWRRSSKGLSLIAARYLVL
jgi:energy-coupling factor transporter ATP-binding protein EcfA2